jgi:signal transduction histidine kinase
MIKHAHILLGLISVACVLSFSADAQVTYADSLKNLLLKEADTAKVQTMLDIGGAYEQKAVYDTALSYYLEALTLAENTQNKASLFESLNGIAHFYEDINNHPLALEYGLRAQKIAEEQNDKQTLFRLYDFIGEFINFNMGNYDKSIEYLEKMKKIADGLNDKEKVVYVQMSLSDIYREQSKFSEAIEVTKVALHTSKELGDNEKIVYCLHGIGLIYSDQGRYKEAIPYYIASYEEARKDTVSICGDYGNFVHAYIALSKYDSALIFAQIFLNCSKEDNHQQFKMESYSLLERIYAAKKDYKQAYGYLHLYQALKDSVHSTETQNKMDLLESAYKTDKQKKEIELLQKNSSLQAELRNVLIITSVLLVVTAFLVLNKYRQKKKSEAALAIKNTDLQKALAELQSTQAQLIQSEKMASLGELTAGIAHEIQNPLNFVNNFSEVSNELLEEMQAELANGNNAEAIAIANDVKQNLEKINRHGKRADAIVKGMLQHSLKSAGQKELTDINTLADEYLHLSYHGLRAKDKTFNADIQTNFDTSIGKISIIPQDIGRVLLNLFNNAFWAVAEKKRLTDLEDFKNLQSITYKPMVMLTTKKTGNIIILTVRDNGTGIPQSVINKIFQPFFTTKPPGQGTGLGLSLTYDIVKAHGGEIRVETQQGEGTELIVTLPCKT